MIGSILDIINKFIPDSEAAEKAAVELEKEYSKQLAMRHSIIRAEQENGSGKWRVRLMYMCMTMVGLHYIMYEMVPYFIVVLDLDVWTPQAPEATELWSFLKIGVGGYLGGRSIEKTTAWWVSRKGDK